MVCNGETQAKAARLFGIPLATLSRRLRDTTSRQEAREMDMKLSKTQETFVKNWILHKELCGRAPIKRVVQGFAQQILIAEAGPRQPEQLGIYWVDKFLFRHPDFRTKVGRVISQERIRAANPKSTKAFYEYLSRVRSKYSVIPEHEYNMDETGL
jgi:hypothetical protein